MTQQPLGPIPGANEADPGCDQCDNAKELTLEKCRTLKCQYFAGEAGAGSSLQLAELLELYSKLARRLQAEGQIGLSCQAMNECGDLTHLKIGIR